jgi:Sulfotransferase domain
MKRRKPTTIARAIAFVLGYGLFWPFVKIMSLLGRWPAWMSRGIDKSMGKFPDYEPDQHDVLVCSYFKSGTNWTLQIATQIAWRGRAQFEHIHDLVSWAEIPSRARYAVSIDDDAPREDSPTGLRVIKTHLCAERVPYSTAARYICVVRDPKDVFASSYHFIRSTALGTLMPTPAQWLDLFLSDDAPFWPWAQHVEGYWRLRDRPNVLFMTYEEMKADLGLAVRKIAAVMDVELGADEFDAVVRQSSFAHMKSIGHKFDPPNMSPFGRAEGAMIRRGERGSASEILSADQQARVDDYCRADLQRRGSEFAYDRAFATSLSAPPQTTPHC